MADLNARGTPSRRFPPVPESVAEARRFVTDALGDVAPERVDTARLLVSELVTNAVLHARTEVEVAVRVDDGTVGVRVSDRRPDRPLVPHGCPAYAGTGQGLPLVARLSSRHGVETGDASKTVWFELRSQGPPRHPDAWESDVTPSVAGETVTLLDVPSALYSASQQHRHALLRELAVTAGPVPGVSREDLAVALDVSNLITAAVTGALRQRPAEGAVRSLPLSVPPDAGPSVRMLRAVLEEAEEGARAERLLTLPSLPRHRLFHEWLFDEIAGQLAGADPTAWTVVPGVSASEPVAWEAGQVQAVSVPTIAADERNRIIAVNGPASELLGWHPDELTGRPITTLVPEHLRKRHIAAFTSLLLSGQPRILGRSVPLPALHRDGRLVPVRLFIQPQETADGRTVFVAQLTPRAAVPGPVAHPLGRARPTARPGPRRPSSASRPGRTKGGPERADRPALERLSLLADTAAALTNAPHLAEGLERVGRILTQRLADWCAVDLFVAGAEVERVSLVHRSPPGRVPAEYEGPLPSVSHTARGPLARALRGAGPLLLTGHPSPGEIASPLDAHYLGLFRTLGMDSAVVAPLRARRQIIGALTLARRGPEEPFTEEDLPLVHDLVRSLALGVDNARLHQETRNIAERLQRSLLPVLPEVESLRLAARYAASSATAQVGGDWYDSFILPSGDTALVIGDVTGHNLDAAIAMSQLRSMLRGIAVDRQEPPEVVLRRLDMANHSLYREATATCIYGLVKGGAKGPWWLVHSSAGHLPPLLVGADGRTRFLEQGSGLLLGVDPDMPRPTSREAIPAHSTVLLYTDGLVERREEHLDHALERLRHHASQLAREPLDVLCDELLIRLGADSDDDIALLALRPTPPR